MAMTLAEAADTYKRLQPQLRKMRSELADAEDVLKTHFRRPRSRGHYRGIAYEASTFRAIDVTLARQALGEKAADCEVERSRERLILLEEPARAAAAA